MVAESEGRFRPVSVEAGPERNDETVILSGLEAGQQVVVSGQFLIDSEASLLGAYQRIGAGGDMKGMEGMSESKAPAMNDMDGMKDMKGMGEMQDTMKEKTP